MGKKMNLPFPFKSSSQTKTPPPSWPWPSACTTPKTMSFRGGATTHDIIKTVNSAYLDASNSKDFVETPKSCFNGSNVFEESFATAREVINVEEIEEEEEEDDEDSIETTIRGLRSSERLFFEPENKSIIVEEISGGDLPPFTERSLAMTVDSTDPFADFKKSMEEMVEAHGLKDWDCLEELLTCYLKVNCKSNHGYIVGAFVDLLIGFFAFAPNPNPNPNPNPLSSSDSTNFHDLLHCSSSTTTTHSFTSPLSICSSTFSNSPCLSSSLEVDDEKSVNNVVVTTSSSVSSSSAN